MARTRLFCVRVAVSRSSGPVKAGTPRAWARGRGQQPRKAARKKVMMKSRVRYLLIMLIFVVSAVVYIDRSNISIAGTYLAADYHISKVQLSWVFSAFLLGY